MTTANVSVVINNYFTGNATANATKGQTIYSVVVTHEAEAHENYLYTDKEKALAKMEQIKASWVRKNVTIHPYREGINTPFGHQYNTKLGCWYENDGCKDLFEYGYVELIECVLE